MARIVVGGAGAIGASIAYQLARRGAHDVVLCDRATVASGASGRAFGGVRQQFSAPGEVRLAQASLDLFETLGATLFDQVGYLFVATSDAGARSLEARVAEQRRLGVVVEHLSTAQVAAVAPGVATDDVHGGAFGARDGVSDPPAVTRELLRRAVELGVQVREGVGLEAVDGDIHVVASGAWSASTGAALGVELPVRPLVRQLLETTALSGLPASLPVVIESDTGFHFRRRGARLLVAMAEPEARWGTEEVLDRSVLPDRLARLARRLPAAAATEVAGAWAGLYDMTPDARPIIDRVRDDLLVACGFSGHGFMLAPAVGEAIAELVVDGETRFDLEPFRLGRFAPGCAFPDRPVL